MRSTASTGRSRRARAGVLPLVLSILTAATVRAGGPPSGEPFRPAATVRIGTVLGYGEPMALQDAPPHIAAPEAGGDVVWGADIGIPVTLTEPAGDGLPRPLTFLFFGDTDMIDRAYLQETGTVRRLEPPAGTLVTPTGVVQGDGYAYATDTDPSDGFPLAHFFRNLEPGDAARSCPDVDDLGYRAMYVPGVHPSPCASGLDLGGEILMQLLTPTGAWSMGNTLLVVIADQTPYDGIPQASSYLAASTDLGLTWTPLENGQPFSSPISGGGASKFVHVDAVPVDAAEYQDPARSGPCLLPLPPGGDTRGWLLFGAGLWTQSEVHLAFLARSELEAAVADPSRGIQVHYFAGTSGPSCWSTDEADAVPVVRAFDNRAFAHLETACGHHVIRDTVGAGYVTVTRMAGEIAGTQVDRLVMLFNSGYLVCKASSPDTCCGGILAEDGTCIGADLDRYADHIVEGSAGIVMVTGETWRPWVWNLLEPSPDGALPDAATHPLRPRTVPPDPAANWYGSGPECQQVMTWRDVITGYAPLILDAFSRPSADGSGFDLYFLVSRWGSKVSPDDPGTPETGYHYMVDLFRTTLRPDPPRRYWPAPIRPEPGTITPQRP